MTPLRPVPGDQPTLSTVAEKAGVSRQTVSNALNNPALLRADTLARVQAAIDELDYRPNRAARQLRTRSSHLVGLRFEPAQEGTSNATMDRFVHSLVEACEETGQHVVLFSGDPDDPLDGYDELLRATSVDAFVVTDTYAGTPQAEFLAGVGAPYVTFGRPWDPATDGLVPEHAWVDVDGAHGARLATEHLLAQGHERVAWLGWELDSRIGADRRSGWAAAGSPGPAVELSDNVDAARLAAHGVLGEGVTAFACVSDTVALGVLHACHERGLRPGAEIGITGFDDSLAAQVAWPGLTSVRQPLEQAARELVVLLAAVLSDEPVTPKGRLLQPSLVERGSSRR